MSAPPALVPCPTTHELSCAREMAEIVLSEATLTILCTTLAHEHPSIDDPHPRDPITLRAARRLAAHARALRRELREYRALFADHEVAEDLPF